LEASRGAPGTPRDRPEGPQERPGTPGGAPGSAWECFRAAKIDAKSRPGAQKSIFSRAARSRSVVAAIFRRFLSIFGLFVKSANPPKYRACRQNQGFGHSRYESRRSRNVASKNNENQSQNRPEIVKNRVSGHPGRPCRSTFAARSASVEQLGQLGAMRKRPSRSKRVDRGRSRRPRSLELAGTPKIGSPRPAISLQIYVYIVSSASSEV